MKKHKSNSETYTWGENCQGWHLVKNDALGVIQEIIPPDKGEVLHKHNKTQQFFFILEGSAVFTVEGEDIEVSQGEGIHITAGKRHKIVNRSYSDMEMLVISQPHAHLDRENIL